MLGARTKSWMLMLLGAVGIVLLIACANVANLLLARATAREREVGIRAALGAGRWRLIRQLMVESLVLSILGTVLATVLAWWAVQVLRTSMPDGVPRVAAIAVDLRVLAASAALALITGTLFGIFPALQLSKPDLTAALKEGARGASSGRARQRMRSALVVIEVALAVVLLVGAALFIGSFMSLMRIDPGFESENVLTVQVSPRYPPGPIAPTVNAARGIRADRRASPPDAGGHPRRDDFRRDAARRQHELDLDDRAGAEGGRPDWDQHSPSDARLSPRPANPAQGRTAVRTDGSRPGHQTSSSSASSRRRNTSPVRMQSGRR